MQACAWPCRAPLAARGSVVVANLPRMRMRPTILSLGAALTLFAGCGGDDDAPIEPIGTTTSNGESTEGSVSKADFLAGADPSCAEANAAIANLATTTGDNLELAATQEQQITQGVLENLEALAPPADPDGSLDRYLSALQEQVSILSDREQAAASGDTATYETLGGELAQAKADARLAAEEFGFEDCGQEGTSTAPTDSAPGATGGTTVPVEPTTPAPAPAPAPEPVPVPPATGGTGTGGGGGTGSGGSGSSGGVSPG